MRLKVTAINESVNSDISSKNPNPSYHVVIVEHNSSWKLIKFTLRSSIVKKGRKER